MGGNRPQLTCSPKAKYLVSFLICESVQSPKMGSYSIHDAAEQDL
jgi:hypothetical protein